MKNFFNNYLKILKTNFDKLDLLKISKLQKLIIET